MVLSECVPRIEYQRPKSANKTPEALPIRNPLPHHNASSPQTLQQLRVDIGRCNGLATQRL